MRRPYLLLDPSKDPARRLLELPILRYATEIWHATERSQARPKNLKLGTVVSGVRTVLGRLASDNQKANGAKGPINAMIGAANEIGWALVDPVTFVDQNRQLISITQGSPARLRKLIHRAIADKLEEQFTTKLVKDTHVPKFSDFLILRFPYIIFFHDGPIYFLMFFEVTWYKKDQKYKVYGPRNDQS